jgi:hypothetical protein
MADQSGQPDTDDDTNVRPDHELSSGVPRWVKVVGVIVAVLVLLFIILQLAGVGGEHGPGRHAPPGTQTPPSHVTGAHTPPTNGGHG